MEQPRQAEEIREDLAIALDQPVTLRFGRSRSQPVQARWVEDHWELRLHQMFAAAPPQILSALCRWLQVGRRARRACTALDGWLQDELARLPAPGPGPLRPQGRCHDLRPLRDDCAAAFVRELQPEQLPAITWGRRGRSRGRHSLQLGSYHPDRHLIRVHPALDDPQVPAWFVAFVIFHELLHAALVEERDSRGRILKHGPAFRRREASHPDHAAALRFERGHLERLLQRARQGA